MQKQAKYELIFKEIRESSTIDTTKFGELYHALRQHTGLDSEDANVYAQQEFVAYIKRVIHQLPQYCSTLIELLNSENKLDVKKAGLLEYLETHYGVNNIHKIEFDLNNRESLSAALGQMYNNLFDRQRLTTLTNFDYGFIYNFQIIGSTKETNTNDHGYKAESQLFTAIVADPELREKLVEYIKLINAIHYTLGSEGDIRYPDERVLFEVPMYALLKQSPKYIPLFIECLSLYNRWHDVSALDIAYSIPSLHPHAEELIYVYASAYGRAMANYELIDSWESEIHQKLTSPEYRQKFIKLLAADSVACSIAMNYELRNLKEEDLEDVLDIQEWEDGFEESTLGEYLVKICTEEEYEELVETYDNAVQTYIYNPEESPIAIFPPSYESITNIKLNDQGDTFNEPTPESSIIYNSGTAGFIRYEEKDYLILGEETWIRIVDFQKKEQVTVRELTGEDPVVDVLLTTEKIEKNSPVHFITLTEGIIQGWSLKEFQDTFKIKANVKEMFLTNNGKQLAILTDEFEEYDYGIVNMDFSNEKEDTVIFIDLISLTEISRWDYHEDYNDPLLTKDGKFFFATSESGILKWDTYTGEKTVAFPTNNDLDIVLELSATKDSSKLLVDNTIYSLPDLQLHGIAQSYEYGNWYTSQSNIAAKYGDTASTENSFCFSDLKTGKVLSRLFTDPEKSHTSAFFSPDEKYFCAILDSDVHIWNLENVLAGDEIEKFKFNFPSVATSIFEGGRIISIAKRKENFINTVSDVKFELLEFGKYYSKSEPIRTSTNFLKLSPNSTFIEETNSITPEIGDALGVKLKFDTEVVQRIFDFRIRIHFPEQTDPSTGENLSFIEWNQIAAIEEEILIGWEFTEQFMLKASTWIIEVDNMEGTQTLFRKLFYINEKFIPVDFDLKKKFVGVNYLNTSTSQETRKIIGAEGISFGIQFGFSCDIPNVKYKLTGEMEHPPVIDPNTGTESSFTTRKFIMSNGMSIGYFHPFRSENEIAPGLWTFRIKDTELGNTLIEEQLEVIGSDSILEPEFKLINQGVYTSDENWSVFNNYPDTEKLRLTETPKVIKLEVGSIFGFTCQFKHLIQAKKLAVKVYHPLIKSMFGDDSEEELYLDVTNDKPQFIGWTVQNNRYILDGDWTIKVWEDEINESEEPLFQTRFQTSK